MATAEFFEYEHKYRFAEYEYEHEADGEAAQFIIKNVKKWHYFSKIAHCYT